MIEDVSLPLELVAHAEIGHVARMDHEVDVVASIERPDRIFGFVVPSLRVAYLRKTNRSLAFASSLDASDIAGIDTRFAIDACIVGMVFDLTGSQKYSNS